MKTVQVSIKQYPVPHSFNMAYTYHPETGEFIILRIDTGTWEARQAVEQFQNHPHFNQWMQEAAESTHG